MISCVYRINDDRYRDFEIELTPNDSLAIFHLQPSHAWSAYSRADLKTIRTEYSCMESPEYCRFSLSRISAEFIAPLFPWAMR
ncbi:hypothetical protein [Endozoicomonas numazuensis]|uniref:Uncharacterized protein n=1 Tax=Endozoicomonas numazuensis TaxID=1137799 RepID=A0A081NEK8_9GAMM|nr:hypothetical protein [Endozoicomonas numazuensis]KEQ16881.1 hypothetical protein GZ78_19695 [Endozoicomonas numazuensis]